jgi:hypothetical protein
MNPSVAVIFAGRPGAGRHRRASALAAVICLAGASLHASVFATSPLSPRLANYDIHVTLDPAAKTLEGTQLLTWTNPSADPITELRFHLYLNAFRHSETTFLRDNGRRWNIGPDEWGWIDVTSIAVVNGGDLTSRMEFIQPDDGNALDRTVMRVPLTTPVGTQSRDPSASIPRRRKISKAATTWSWPTFWRRRSSSLPTISAGSPGLWVGW